MEALGQALVVASCIGAVVAFQIYGLEGWGWFVLIAILVVAS